MHTRRPPVPPFPLLSILELPLSHRCHVHVIIGLETDFSFLSPYFVSLRTAAESPLQLFAVSLLFFLFTSFFLFLKKKETTCGRRGGINDMSKSGRNVRVFSQNYLQLIWPVYCWPMGCNINELSKCRGWFFLSVPTRINEPVPSCCCCYSYQESGHPFVECLTLSIHTHTHTSKD